MLTIGHGHQLIAELRGPPFGSAQRPLLVLMFVVFGTGVHVLLAVAQHGID